MSEQLKCELCNKRFSGKFPYQQHLESAQHIKLSIFSKQESILNCKFCKKEFSGVESYIQHVGSSDHLRVVSNTENKEKASVLQLFRERPELMKCPECEVSFTNWTNADDHFRSNQHIKKISDDEKCVVLSRLKPKAPSPKASNISQSRCDVCNVQLSGKNAVKQHCEGKAHLKRLKAVRSEFKETAALDIKNGLEKEVRETCYVCDVTLMGQQSVDNHYAGKKHKKLAELDNKHSNHEVIESTSQTNEIVANGSEKEVRETCYVCDVTLMGQQSVDNHYAGKKHKKKLAELDNKHSNHEVIESTSQTNEIVAQKPINVEELVKKIKKLDIEKQRLSIDTDLLSNSSILRAEKFVNVDMPEKGELQETAASHNVKNDSKKEVSKICCICNVPLMGKQAIQEHYIGKKHLKELAELDNKHSNHEVIESTLQTNGIVAQKPINDEELVKKIKKLDIENKRPSIDTDLLSNSSILQAEKFVNVDMPERGELQETAASDNVKNDSKKEVREICCICNAPLMGKQAIHEHYIGKKHLKKKAEDNKCRNCGIIKSTSQTNEIVAPKPIIKEELVRQTEKLKMQRFSIESRSSNSSSPDVTPLFHNTNTNLNVKCNAESLKLESCSDNLHLDNIFEVPNISTQEKSHCDIELKANLQQFESKQCELQNSNIKTETCLYEMENSRLTNRIRVLKDNGSIGLSSGHLLNRLSNSPVLKMPPNDDLKINQMKNNDSMVHLSSKPQINVAHLTEILSLGPEKSNREKTLIKNRQRNNVTTSDLGPESTVINSQKGRTDWRNGCLICGILSFNSKSAYKWHVKTEAHIAKASERSYDKLLENSEK